jgi:hypothetical protein
MLHLLQLQLFPLQQQQLEQSKLRLHSLPKTPEIHATHTIQTLLKLLLLLKQPVQCRFQLQS